MKQGYPVLLYRVIGLSPIPAWVRGPAGWASAARPAAPGTVLTPLRPAAGGGLDVDLLRDRPVYGAGGKKVPPYKEDRGPQAQKCYWAFYIDVGVWPPSEKKIPKSPNKKAPLASDGAFSSFRVRRLRLPFLGVPSIYPRQAVTRCYPNNSRFIPPVRPFQRAAEQCNSILSVRIIARISRVRGI